MHFERHFSGEKYNFMHFERHIASHNALNKIFPENLKDSWFHQ